MTPKDPLNTGDPDGDLLPLLLEICEAFLASTSPAVRREVDTFLVARNITGGPGWLIDMLARSSLRLQSSAHEDRLASDPS